MSRLTLLLAALCMMPPPREPTLLDGVDIDLEYSLIQKKKSKLSARMRKAVVAQYKRNQIELE